MNKRPTRVRAAVGALALATGATGLAVGLIGPASSAVSVPWTDADAVGTITFYDSTGAQQTTGSIDDPLPAYAVGSALPRSGDTVGALFAYTPTKSADDWAAPGEWSGSQLTAATTFPSSGPAAVTNAAAATATGTDATTLAQYLATYPNASGDSTLGGAYELRLRTSAPGDPSGPAYDVVDIVVSGTTWTVASQSSGGSQAVATHTTLAASAASVTTGTSVTLTATVDQSAAAGTVQFSDGSTAVGSPVPVSGGVATTTVTPATGSHGYGAVFTPSDTTAYLGSTSNTVAVTASAPSGGNPGGGTPGGGTAGTGTGPTTVTPGAVTSIKKATIKSSAKKLKLKVTSTATTAIKVKVYDGKKLIGTATIKNGKLTLKLKKKLKKGKHSLKVKYAGSASVSAFTKTVKVKVK